MATVSKPSVCRRLFAEEDNDEPREVGENRANRFIEELNRQEVESFIARYNFDPRTETPLEGNFVWSRRREDGKWELMPVGQPQGAVVPAAPGDQQAAPPAPGDQQAPPPASDDPAPDGGGSSREQC